MTHSKTGAQPTPKESDPSNSTSHHKLPPLHSHSSGRETGHTRAEKHSKEEKIQLSHYPYPPRSALLHSSPSQHGIGFLRVSGVCVCSIGEACRLQNDSLGGAPSPLGLPRTLYLALPRLWLCIDFGKRLGLDGAEFRAHFDRLDYPISPLPRLWLCRDFGKRLDLHVLRQLHKYRGW